MVLRYKAYGSKGFAAFLLAAGFLTTGVIYGFLYLTGNPLSMEQFIVTSAILLSVIAFFVWIWFGTWYEIRKQRLVIRSGPVTLSVPIERITEIHPRQKSTAGLLKFALSRNSIMIVYKPSRTVHIASVNDEDLVGRLREINPGIEVKEQ